MILKRNKELRNISDFIINDLFRDIISGPDFTDYLASAIFTAPSGNGLSRKSEELRSEIFVYLIFFHFYCFLLFFYCFFR